jgi:transposase
MVCLFRARRRLKNHPHGTAPLRQKSQCEQSGVAASAAAAARSSFVGTFCAAGLLETAFNKSKEEPAVTIPLEAEAQILRYYHVEKWRIGTIARQLHLHYDTVARVLAQAGLPRHGQPPRPSKADPYLPLIRETLEKFPTLTASRLYAMARERGYGGGPSHFRSIVARHRPRPKAEAYLRLRTLPGEQAQVDWGHFGHLTIGRARRPLMAFVMVLSWSRMIYLHFFLNARMENFLRGHAGAFAAWDGVPRVLLYDNLKSAVLERQGEAIRFNPAIIDFARHHRFEPRPVAVARGNEKGRVERAIRYIRDNFFAARAFTDVDDLNAQAKDWCLGPAADRLCPEDKTITVREAFAQEAPKLMASPEEPYPVFERAEVKAAKTPYVRFDWNDYSIPHTHLRKPLTVFAGLHELRIADKQDIIACHERSFDKGAQIENPAHIQALAEHKHAASRQRATDKLVRAVPACRDLLIRAAARNDNLGSLTAALMRLLECYGATEMQEAVLEALSSGTPHPNSVRCALDRRREARNLPPPVAVNLSECAKAKDAAVRSHNLGSYDTIERTADE